MTGRGGRRSKQLLDSLKWKRGYWNSRGSTRSQSVKNSLRKKVRTCRQTDYGMDEWFKVFKIRNRLQHLITVFRIWLKQGRKHRCGLTVRRVRTLKPWFVSCGFYWPNSNNYTGCPGRNVPDFGRMFLKLKYIDITQNTYIRSWTVTEIMARILEVSVTHLLITKYILKLAGICGFCNVNICT